MSERQNKFGILCVIFCEVIYGFSFIFTKYLASKLDMPSMLGWRFIFAFIGINIPVIFGFIKLDIQRKHIPWLLLVGLFMPVSYFSCETIGVKLTTASESSAMIACIPIVTLMISCVRKKQWPNTIEVLGFFFALIGALGCIVVKGLEASLNVLGYLMLFGAVITFSYFCLIFEKLSDISNFAKTYVTTGIGAIFFVIVALIKNASADSLTYFLYFPFMDVDNVSSLVYLGIVCSVLGFFLYNFGISTIGARCTVSFDGIAPIVAIVAGVHFLNEYVSLPQILFSITIIIGITMINICSNKS